MDQTLGTKEAAQGLGCTPKTLWAWVSHRRVQYVKVGRLMRFRLRDLEQWLDEHSVPAERQP